MFRSGALIVTLLLAAPVATGEGWECRNESVEITCDAEACAVTETHTPMHVHIDAGRMSVCAYTGCWEGDASITASAGQFLWITGDALPFSTMPDSTANMALQLDRETQVATLIVSGGFAHPMRCSPWPEATNLERSEPSEHP